MEQSPVIQQDAPLSEINLEPTENTKKISKTPFFIMAIVAIVALKAPQLALDVIIKGMTWEEAFANDWRKTKSWQPGWEYSLP